MENTPPNLFREFQKHRLGLIGLIMLGLFTFFGLYAPFFASSKPLYLIYQSESYFPLFRYLFFQGFFTKRLDIFYNLLMFTLPLTLLGFYFLKKFKSLRRYFLYFMAALQIVVFIFLITFGIKDPAIYKKNSPEDSKRENFSPDRPFKVYPKWSHEVEKLSAYAQIEQLLRFRIRKEQEVSLIPFSTRYLNEKKMPMPTLWQLENQQKEEEINRLESVVSDLYSSYQKAIALFPLQLKEYRRNPTMETLNVLTKSRSIIESYRESIAKLKYLNDRAHWLIEENQKLSNVIMPFIRPFHWEDDAGGEQNINRYVSWWHLTRINRKDLVSALLFGIRISLIVGFTAVSLAILIGVPLGSISGYLGGKWDLLICRFIEIWETMPTFFMLLTIVAITQTKSIFLIVIILGFFGWTHFCRFMRAEVLKQRNLPYVLACQNLGFGQKKILFNHILPNAIPPILTLLPFSMMAAITSEAGLSFLGLGEEGSCSWGILMDEGRAVFPGESYLLWPPAILLTFLLISIALVGDSLRDALDPKMNK